jgi:biopolymer transport protein ExbB/TolQ
LPKPYNYINQGVLLPDFKIGENNVWEKESLEKEVQDLKKELDQLKSKKKIEEEEIKHLVKIKDEKREIEFQKKEMEIQKDADSKVMKVKQDYQDKIESNLQKQIEDTKQMYAEILQRLPNIAVRLKGDV